MSKTYDVVALGELLVDYVQVGMSERGNPFYEANVGGAPANVLAMLRKLGAHCAFMGAVGQDPFGDLLEKALSDAQIDTRGLRRCSHVPTTVAIVHNRPDGERAFSFYRNPGADTQLSPENLDMELLQSCKVFHFGSLSLTTEPSRAATQIALKQAKEAGALVSFDPNLRPLLWENLEDAKREIGWGLSQCDLLKIADNELQFVTGCENLDEGVAVLQQQYPSIRLICVTEGAKGSRCYYDSKVLAQPAFRTDSVIDTTGAGDTFCACLIHFALTHGLEDCSDEQLKQLLRFANAAAYLVTTRTGAFCSMPEKEEVDALLNASNH